MGTPASTARGSSNGHAGVVDAKNPLNVAQFQRDLNQSSSAMGQSIKNGQQQHQQQPTTRKVIGLGDATVRINNSQRTTETLEIKPQQQQQQQQPQHHIIPPSTSVSVRQNENAVVMNEYFVASTNVVTSNANRLPPAAANANRNSVSSLYRTHSSRAATQTILAKKPQQSAAQIVSLTDLPTQQPHQTFHHQRQESLPSYDESLPSAFHSSSENVHVEPLEDVADLQKGFETINLDANSTTAAPLTLLVPSSSSNSPIDTLTVSTTSITSTPLANAPSSTDSELLPPPCLEAHVATPDAEVDFPRRNSTARSMPSHFILPSELEDIRSHLRVREKDISVHPNYMSLQPELNYRMREILLDWLSGVSGRFRLKAESLLLATNLLDRFLSKRECGRDKFQLVGITCLILGAKYEEILPPSIDAFIQVTDNAFQKSGIKHMETVILDTVGFELTIPYVTSFTGPLLLLCPLPDEVVVSTTHNFESELKNLAMYYCLVQLQHHQFLQYPSSIIGASIVALAYFNLYDDMYPSSDSTSAVPYWDSEMVKASGYELSDLIDCMIDLSECVNSMMELPRTPGQPIVQKYNSITKRYQRIMYDEVANRVCRLPEMVKRMVEESRE